MPAASLAHLLHAWQTNRLTRPAAKGILASLFREEDEKAIEEIIAGAEAKGLGEGEYVTLAEDVMAANETVVKEIKEKSREGKVMFLVGQMMRAGAGKGINPQQAEAKLRELLGLPVKS